MELKTRPHYDEKKKKVQLIRLENEDFRKRFSNKRNLKTLAWRLSGDRQLVENGHFSKRRENDGVTVIMILRDA